MKQEQITEEEKKEEEAEAVSSAASGNYKEIINGEEVTTVVPSQTTPAPATIAVTDSTTASNYRAPEKQVKITVGQQEPEEVIPSSGQPLRTFDEDTYNKYLLDDSGPRKVIDYSRV